MHEELISKKDLLIQTGISYGQLYRWKRKNIIPEEWFIKKSVSTGQETFFPKDKILERINKILELKDELSLDELANRFSNNNIDNVSLFRSYIIKENIVNTSILEMFENVMGECDVYDENKLFSLFLYEDLINSGILNINEINNIVLESNDVFAKIESNNKLLIKRKLGVCFYYMIDKDEELFSDKEAKTIYEISLYEIINKIKSICI
ncbi:hypothetical protein BH721_02370 [Clostridium baratii]|uniref:DUF4004 family protein n=1 Tax=Clostridium baratii TaxID=1561 RepID=UPI0009A3EBAB|nr:DUF4004 family protein [Clostridium baratii]OPF51353.1 hypothetical protein A1M12_02105 [Clostridium baratii]OPF55572.1 hypothetical protein BH721_02370 [Clostridium baratii]OPF57049.1 hypothetical protein BH724_11060 [Clostridium baratii]OPF60047.1 hypothetical protein BH725_05555 [Clostridium baratii]